jgi:exodeoxyribonuclease VII large subunit
LEQFDIRLRLGVVRSKLAGVDSALRVAAVQTEHRAGTRLQTCAARLESLSPLSVLGRGYSVVWDETRTRVLRRSTETKPGDRVRITLSRGELQCSVTSTDE